MLLHFSFRRHPKTVVAHLGFKTMAVLAYIFSSFYTSSYIIVFITVITWLSLDFWCAVPLHLSLVRIQLPHHHGACFISHMNRVPFVGLWLPLAAGRSRTCLVDFSWVSAGGTRCLLSRIWTNSSRVCRASTLRALARYCALATGFFSGCY